jgi:hypothetical protein
VDGTMMAATQQREIREDRGPAVRPVADVVTLAEPHAAAGEATAAVSMLQRSAECGRDRACPGADFQQLAVGVTTHDHPAGVAGQTLGRSSWNAYAVFEHRLPRRFGVRQHRGIHVDHDLVALAGRAGIDPVMERGLGEECERIGCRLVGAPVVNGSTIGTSRVETSRTAASSVQVLMVAPS